MCSTVGTQARRGRRPAADDHGDPRPITADGDDLHHLSDTPSEPSTNGCSPAANVPPARRWRRCSIPCITDADVDWLKTNFVKTELELGHCLPAAGRTVRVRPLPALPQVHHHVRL